MGRFKVTNLPNIGAVSIKLESVMVLSGNHVYQK